MPSASKSRRGRSRKRRPDPADRARRSEPKAPPPPTPTHGGRPRPPWHPLPLAELLIFVGAIGAVIGLRRQDTHGGGGAPLIAGLVAVGLGTFEVTLREHSGGYRSHTILLALVPVLVFHSLVVVGAIAIGHPPRLLSVYLLPLDLVLFVFFFKLLRARYREARQARAVGRR